MSYYSDGLVVYDDDGDMVIEIDDDDEYRNAGVQRRAYRDTRDYRRGRRPTGAAPARRRVVVRRPSEPKPAVPVRRTPTPVVVEQPVLEREPETGVNIGGFQVSFATVAGTLLTLGGLGLQVASHFVGQPEPPTGDEDDVTQELVDFAQAERDSKRRTQLLDTIGRALSDMGQLAAFRS